MLLPAERAQPLGQPRVGPGARTGALDLVLPWPADLPVYAGELIAQIQLYDSPFA